MAFAPARGSLSICMVTTFYPPYSFGGDAMHVDRPSNELGRRGHRITVVHSVDAYRAVSGGRPGNRPPYDPGVTVVPVESRFGRLSPLVTYLGGRPGYGTSEALEGDFDVVHFHNVSLVGGPGVLALGRGVKLNSLHEHWLVCPMHVLWRDNREPCYAPHCLRCTLTYRRPPQLWRYTRLLERSLGHVDLFLAPSRFTIDAHRERAFTGPVRRLPMFVPSAEAAGANGRVPHDRPYFLFVGRLERLKGLQTLLEPFREYPADLLIAGDGSYGAELRRRAEGLGNVRFLGRVDPRDLPSLYAGAIALVVPSIGLETAPIVVLEAFAQGTPAIANNLGGLPEAVRDSGAGFVYEDADGLTAALDALRTDPELRAGLGARGKAMWRERWSEEPHVAGYLDAIDEASALAAR